MSAPLRAALIELREFSEAHHADQDKAMLLHALLVDIPHRLDLIIDAMLLTEDLRVMVARDYPPYDAWAIAHEGIAGIDPRRNDE